MLLRLCFVFISLMLVGCSQRHSAPVRQGWSQATSVHAGVYKVLPRETLYAIAFRFDLDFRQIASWNHLSPPYNVTAGQLIRVIPPAPPSGADPVRVTDSSIPLSPMVNLRNEEEGSRSITTSTVQPKRESIIASKEQPQGDKESSVAPSKVQSGVLTPGSSPKSSSLTPSSELKTRSLITTSIPGHGSPSSTLSTEPSHEKSPAQLNDYWVWPSDGPIVRQFGANQNQKGIDIKGELNQPVYAVRSGVVAYCGNGLPGYGNLIIIKHDEEFLSAYAYNAKMFVEEGKIVKAKQKIAEMGISGSGIALLHFEIRKAGKPVNPILYLGQHKI